MLSGWPSSFVPISSSASVLWTLSRRALPARRPAARSAALAPRPRAIGMAPSQATLTAGALPLPRRATHRLDRHRGPEVEGEAKAVEAGAEVGGRSGGADGELHRRQPTAVSYQQSAIAASSCRPLYADRCQLERESDGRDQGRRPGTRVRDGGRQEREGPPRRPARTARCPPLLPEGQP